MVNNMKMLHRYLHEFDFPSSNFLRKNKEDLINYYKSFKSSTSTIDVRLNNTPINIEFQDKIKNLIENNYIVLKTQDPLHFNAYIQGNNNTPSYFHNHIHSPMTICGVFYLDVPKEGGEFEIFDLPHTPSFKIKPQEDKLYIFPSWLYHKPHPQQDEKIRVCINIGYVSNSRPIVKKDGTLW